MAFHDDSRQFPPCFRSSGELIFKTIALHFTCATTAVGLTLLRDVPPDRQWKYCREVLHFLYSPTYPAGQFLLNAINVGRSLWNEGTRGGDWQYFLGCVAGVQAAIIPPHGRQPTRFVPLMLVSPEVALREVRPRHVSWVGMLVLPLIPFLQCVGQLIMFPRRSAMDAIWALDSRNLLTAVGLLIAVLTTWLISIPNLAWSVNLRNAPPAVAFNEVAFNEELMTEFNALRLAVLLLFLIFSHSDAENLKMIDKRFHGLSPGFFTAYTLIALGMSMELWNGFAAWYRIDSELLGWLVFHVGGILLFAIELAKDVEKFRGCPERCEILENKRYFWNDPRAGFLTR